MIPHEQYVFYRFIRSRVGSALSLLLLTVALGWVIPFNGAPLIMWADSLGVAFEAKRWMISPYQPAFYPFLTQILGVGISLYPILWLQVMLLAYCLLRTHQLLFPSAAPWEGMLGGLLVAVTSVASFYLALLKQDAYTPILILAFVMVLWERHRLALIGAVGIYLLAIIVHQTHIGVAAAMCITAGLLAKPFQVSVRRIALASALWAAATLSIPLLSYVVAGKFSFPTSTEKQFVGGLMEAEILPVYLDAVCPDVTIPACQYKDELKATNRSEFIFLTPANLISFAGDRRKLADLSLDVIRRFPKLFLQTVWQRCYNSVFVDRVRSETWHFSYAYETRGIASDWPAHADSLRQARQLTAAESLQASYLRLLSVQNILDALGAVLVLLVIALRRTPRRVTLFAALLAMGLLSNLVIACGLVTGNGRFLLRVEWLLAWFLLVAVLRFLRLPFEPSGTPSQTPSIDSAISPGHG